MTRRIASVFMGTPEFAVPSLEILAERTDLRLVVTQPDRPVGRGRRIAPTPVKVAAARLGVEVAQPDIVKGRRFTQRVAELEPDVIVTAAFGRMLGRGLLDLPPIGCINVHASLLPRYRGAAPVQWAIIRGEKRTGVTIARMTDRLDAGPVLGSKAVDIGEEETAGELSERLAVLGGKVLADALDRIGDLASEEQDESLVTWAPALHKGDGAIDWSLPAEDLANLVRGVHPWPCASTTWDGRPLKVHRARAIEPRDPRGRPGEVATHTAEGIDVSCGEGALRLLEVQLPGRDRQPADRFFAGTRIPAGSMLGLRGRSERPTC